MNKKLSPHQKKCLQALCFLEQLCSENNICLYLIEGTALGAVRHKGFIPWDDDIDIGLKYSDWIRLRELLSSNLELLKMGGYCFKDRDVDCNYPRMQPKITFKGRNCIDIFLLSKWVESRFLGNIKKRLVIEEINILWRFLNYKRKYRPEESQLKKVTAGALGIIRNAIYQLYRINHTYNDIIKLLKKNEEKLEDTGNREWYINLYGAYSESRERILGKWIDESCFVEFEGRQYRTIGHTDQYLSNLYGDYMKLPPKSERRNAHNELF